MKKIALAAVVATAAIAAAVPSTAQPQGELRSPRAAQSLTRASFESRVEARFARADANRDGYITQEEVRTRATAVRGERRAKLFARIDSNGDGSISRAEFDARGARAGDRAERRHHRMERRGARMEHRAARGGAGFGLRAFAALDADKDGRISLGEARARAAARFERLDSNNDGVVSVDERRAAREARGERRRQG